jgi:hypothetical protein
MNGTDIVELNPSVERWLTPTALAAGNLTPLLGVFLWDWDVGAIVMLYWAENLVIGAITILKMYVTQPVGAIFMSAFFLVHYGGFTAVHGFIVAGMFDTPVEEGLSGSWPFFLIFVEMLIGVVASVFGNASKVWLASVAAIAASHLLSFFVHFYLRGERHDATLKALMTAPYKRVLVLHVAIIAGGFAVAALESPLPLLVILVLLKIALDTHMHMRSHKLL